MTKHILTQDSITAAKALVCRLCENGHVRMSVPVDFARDEDMLICALIDVAEKSLAAPTSPASGALPADDNVIAYKFQAPNGSYWYIKADDARTIAYWKDKRKLIPLTDSQAKTTAEGVIYEPEAKDPITQAFVTALAPVQPEITWATCKPWDMLTTPEKAASLIEELESTSSRVTRHNGNSRFDVLLEAAADVLRELTADLAALASREASPASLTITDAMVDAYLVAQRRTVEEADRFGRPNVGGLHANTVREACRAGLEAAALASPQVAPAPTPAAWLRNDGGDAWTDAKKSNAINTMGGGGKVMAAMFDRPLYLAAPAPVAPTLTDEQLDAIAIARYTVVPNPDKVFGYAVHVGNGRGACYRGHRTECESVAARMRTAFLDGAYIARHPDAAQVAPTDPRPYEWPITSRASAAESSTHREAVAWMKDMSAGPFSVAPTPAAQMEEVGVMDYATNTNVRWKDGLTQGALPAGTRLYRAAKVAPTPAQPSQWQPIVTAPKDGREVILKVERRAGVSGRSLVGHYLPGGHCIEDHPPIAAGWYFWNGCMFDVAAKPTHWMPLPSEPEGQP